MVIEMMLASRATGVETPRTAVVVLNWNSAEDTRLCLAALQQSMVPLFVIVVDNASTEYGIEAVCADFPGVVLLKNEANLGFGRGNNVGLKWALAHTVADYFFVLNNDAFIEKDTIGLLEEYLDAHKLVGCVTPQIVFADRPTVVWYGGGEINWKNGSGRVWRWQQPKEISQQPQMVSFVSGCAMMLRRETLLKAGGFDPRYFMYEEDVELSLRVKAAGFKLVYLPQAVVRHRVQGSWRDQDEPFVVRSSPKNPRLPFFMYYQIRNAWLTMRKQTGLGHKMQFGLYFHIRFLFYAVRFGVYGRFDAIKAMLKGYQDALMLRGISYTDEINGCVYKR